MRESILQRHITVYLREHGAYVFKVVGSPLQQRGTPDLLVCWRGQFIGLEIKLPGQAPTPMQAYELQKIQEAGGRSFVVTSLQDTIELLER